MFDWGQTQNHQNLRFTYDHLLPMMEHSKDWIGKTMSGWKSWNMDTSFMQNFYTATPGASIFN
jgi:hypothetical protein